jgi:TonB-linked SusC/RagA family outer membrane protein
VGSNNNQSLSYNGIVGSFLMYKPVNLPDDGLSFDPDQVGGNQSNPLDFVNFAKKSSPLTRIINNNYLEYKIIPELTLRLSAGASYTYSDNGEFYPTTTSWGFTSGGIAIYNTSNSINWYLSHTLTYVKKIKKNHYINALLGFDANSYLFKTFSIRAEGFDLQTNNGVDNLDQAKLYSRLPTTQKELSNRSAYFGRVNYNFKNKYFVTGTLRSDGSSKFGENNKFALFPSGALAWTVSKERFMKKLPAISNLKIRTSFGITGNDRIPAYQSLARASSVFYSGTNAAQLGLSINSIANPDLKWETTYQYDAGLDIEFLDGRFVLTADVYAKQTKDMLLLADVASQSGFSRQFRNIGRVDNRGLEFSVNTVNIKKQNFSWSTRFNITFNRNQIKSLGGVDFLEISVPDQINDIGRAVVGKPIGTAYGYVFDGIYQISDFENVATSTLNPGVAKRLGVAVKPGDFKFKDLNGDNIIDLTNDRTVISDSNPQYYGGITNTFTYKSFDLNVLVLGTYGNDVLNVGRYRLEGYQSGNISENYYLNHWTPTNPTNEFPRFNSIGRYDNSSYYVEDASFLRLKNVTLGYNMPQALLKKIKLSNIRLYLTGENLYTLTNYTGFDPEVSSRLNLLSGYETISYPRAATITFGLNLKF